MTTAYATLQDLLDLEGEDAVYAAADRDRDGELNDAEQLAVATAALDATGEMNSYIGQRYDLPLPVVPIWARRICIDITLYRLSRQADSLTKSINKRYEDAIAFLRNVAKGVAGLGIAGEGQAAQSATAATAGEIKGGEVLVTAQPRQFGRGRRGAP